MTKILIILLGIVILAGCALPYARFNAGVYRKVPPGVSEPMLRTALGPEIKIDSETLEAIIGYMAPEDNRVDLFYIEFEAYSQKKFE